MTTTGVPQVSPLSTTLASSGEFRLPTIDWTAPDAIDKRNKALGTLQPVSARFGSKNDPVAVKRIQTALAEAHLYSGPINGKMSPELTGAIKAYQGAHGLRPDGDVGQLTYTALMGGTGAQRPPSGYGLLDRSRFSDEELRGFETSGIDFTSIFTSGTNERYRVSAGTLAGLRSAGGEELPPDQAAAYAAMFTKASGPITQTSVLGVRSGAAGKANGYGDCFVVLTTDGRAFRFAGTTRPGGHLGNSLSPDVNGDGRGDLGCIAAGTYRATAQVYKGAPAFRVTNTNGSDGLAGLRDTAQNGRFATASALTGVLFHQGGTNDPGSVGCQTLPPDQFNRMLAVLHRFGGSQGFTYTLVETDRNLPTNIVA